ncbi:MAG: hypothetical protein JSV66_11300, partial [Trueperaceae bacterium]
EVQTNLSNLLDAYKRSELEPSTGLGIFALSASLSDLPEPSESLMATTAWQTGLEDAQVLLSSVQLEAFRRGTGVTEETDVRGRRGAYLVRAAFELAAGGSKEWSVIADVNQDSCAIVSLRNALKTDKEALETELRSDIAAGAGALAAIVASADGDQWTRDQPVGAHHRSSVLFNVMRGGVFMDGYRISRFDLLEFFHARNREVLRAHRSFFDVLPETLSYQHLIAAASESGSPDLERLCCGYLPLAFSRRHGDPSRPWNRFAIKVRRPDGRLHLDYQGNWRDIFQNWEALAYAFPGFTVGMIATFLNATTADGYNPYRVTRDGVEWEVPEPSSPWSNIGYWSDHQIIYLQKLLEVSATFHPGELDGLLERNVFSHANVPYRIRPYEAMLENPYDTIVFDWERHQRLAEAVEVKGTDGRLLTGPEGGVLHVTMAEKLLVLLLVKLANLVPEGGIWMNTQRPEWNDANNALVGKGLSVVTACYLYRFVAFLQALLEERTSFVLTREVKTFFDAVHAGLRVHESCLTGAFDDRERRAFMDALGGAGSAYRTSLYDAGFSGETVELDGSSLGRFLDLAQAYLEHTLRANRRADALFHAYNLLSLEGGGASIRHLYEMLEGQVAILSSGLLSGQESLDLLTSLRSSRLYRDDQQSYLLYPDRDLPGFLSKNRIPRERVRGSVLLSALLERGDSTLIVCDENGDYHFNGAFKNAKSVRRALDDLGRQQALTGLVATDGEGIVALFEQLFDHASFTGRSGAFFAYEGLGSIYWHMVSKLLLAVQETYQRALEAGESSATLRALKAAYYEVRSGLGFNKTPAEYGAFPADPYSHTPAHAGAQQPGMTGQVKEDVLARLGELGVRVRGGCLGFAPSLLHRAEFLDEPVSVAVQGLSGAFVLELEPGSLAFTFCQVPVVYHLGGPPAQITVTRSDGSVGAFEGSTLDAATSREVFERTGAVARIDVTVPGAALEPRVEDRQSKDEPTPLRPERTESAR